MIRHEQHLRSVESLVYEWARAIDDNRVEDICDLLAGDGRYTVKSRFNTDRDLPVALIDAQSPAQLRDRIKSMRIANIYEPHHYRHIVSGVQIVNGDSSSRLEVRSNFLVVRTMDRDGDMKLFAAGQCRDVVDASGATAKFVSRLYVLDSRVTETLLVIPL